MNGKTKASAEQIREFVIAGHGNLARVKEMLAENPAFLNVMVDGRTYITGTPGTRDWFANLQANPRFVFHLKQSAQADLPATARVISDPAERQQILADPAMRWYQQQVSSLDELVVGSPLVEVIFDEI